MARPISADLATNLSNQPDTPEIFRACSFRLLVILKTQVARGLKWQAINIVGRQLLSLLIFTTLTRLLDPSAFGLVGLVGVYLGFVSMFAEQGIGTALIQRQHLDKQHLDTAFWFNFGCAALLCTGTIAFARPIAGLLGNTELVAPLRWSSLGLVLSALSTIHSTLFIKALDFSRPTTRTLISSAIGGLVGVGLAFAGYGVWALVLQQLTTSFTGTIFLWAVSDYRPALTFSMKHLRDLLGVSSSTFATTILWFLTSRVDQVVIGRLAGIPALGFYLVGSKIPEMAKVMTHEPLAGISLPALSRLQNEPRKLCQAIYDGMELNAAVSFAIFIGYAVTASELVPLVFGAKWAAAADVSALLSLLGLVYVLQVFFHPALLASGGAGRYVLINIWLTIGSLLACLIGIHFGVSYLVLGLIVNSLIVSIPSLLFLRQRVGLSPLKYCRPCLVPAGASLFMVAMIWFLAALLPNHAPAVIVLVVKVAVGACAYLGVLFIFKRSLLQKLLNTAQHAIGKMDVTPAAPPSP